MSAFRRLLLFVVAAVTAALAAPAIAGAVFLGEARDPAGDSTDADPARDLLAAGVSYDRKDGVLIGAVRMRGAPTAAAPTWIGLFAGLRLPDGSCNGYPAVGLNANTDEIGGSWMRLDAADQAPLRGYATKTGTSGTVRLEARNTSLAGRTVNCALAVLSDTNNRTNVYDAMPSIPVKGLAELHSRTLGVPATMRPGRTRTIRLRLTNEGDGPTGPVRVSVKKARGLSVAGPRRVATIRAGGRRTIRLRVRLTSRAASVVTLRITAKAGRLSARTEDRLSLVRPVRKGGGGGGGNTRTPQLCNRYQPDLSGETGGSLVLVPC